MNTYSDYEQRLLDQASGAELDRLAERRASTPICPECNGEGFVRVQICCGQPDWNYGGECCGRPIVDVEDCKACATKADVQSESQS